MRRVAAEARRVLLDMASRRFGVPVDQLAVSDGVVTVKADPSRRVTYGELIGGKRFNVTLTGNDINATTGIAKIKPVQELKNVGHSPRRDDIPAKVDASPIWAVDMKVPGMVHARNVKPPVAGAKLVSVDESSVSGMPGFVKVVSKGNYVAVVCEREEQAIAAARQLKVNWQKPATAPFPASEELFTFMRRATPTSSRESDRHRKYRDGARRGGESHRGRVRSAVPGPHVHRPRARARRSVERPDDDLLQRHEVVRPAQRRGGVSQDPARSRARHLDGGPAGVRSHGGRRCGVRGGVSGEGARPAGARAVVERRRNRVGHEGPRVCHADARRTRRAGQPRGARLRGARRRLQSPRLQRARHGAHRAADGPAPSNARGWWSRLAVGHVRDAEPAHGGSRGVAAARVGNAAPDRQPARSERTAGDVCRRVVHRRAGGGGQGRSGRVPSAASVGGQGRRQWFQAGALDRGRQGGGRGVQVGRTPVAASRTSARSSRVAASHTPIATRPSSPTLPKSR